MSKRARVEKRHKRSNAEKNPAIVEINCSDKLSLFGAVLVGVIQYHDGKEKWKAAERYARSTSQLTLDAMHFRREVEETLEQTPYDTVDVKKVYKYLDTHYPGTYRILVFTESSDTHTVYNSGNNAKHSICLYYSNRHFDLMKTPQKYFRKKHYCVECEKTYEDLKAHTECKIRCRQCFRNGYGYPCEGDLALECPDCHKLFPNQDCLEAHKPYSCNIYHRCIYCDVQYRVRPERPGRGHRCDKNVSHTTIMADESANVPMQQDGPGSSKTICMQAEHHGGVQQSILSWLVKMS